MFRVPHLQGQQPHSECIHAEDDHDAVGDDHAAVGEHDDNRTAGEEKETHLTRLSSFCQHIDFM